MPPATAASRPISNTEMQSNSVKQTVLLAVIINGLPVDSGALFLTDSQGRLLAPRSLLNLYHFNPIDVALEVVEGIDYFDLEKIHGLRFTWNHEREDLTIVASPDAFSKNKLNIGAANKNRQSPSLYSPGAFLNYDLSFARSAGVMSKQALIDVGIFGGTGLWTSSVSLNDLTLRRLMTTYSVDDTDNLRTIKFGDAVNNTGTWGRALLFGGIQYSSNFAIRPDFISVAMPSISGKAVLPSTVDIYVNNTLRTRQKVDAGPFSIQNLPLITGTGEVQLVVKDLLGREQIITQSFFSSPNLLRVGLVEDAYELGWVRKNYGQASNDYAHPFFATTYRKGLSDTWTGEARMEVQKQVLTSGVSLATTLPTINSTMETNLVVSRDSSGQAGASTLKGSAFGTSFSYLGRRWSANAKVQWNSIGFRQLGSDPNHLIQRVSNAQFNLPWGSGIMALNYFQQKNYGSPSLRMINLAYSRSVSKQIYASAMVVKTFGEVPTLSVGLGVTIILDARHFASATTRLSKGANTLYADVQQSTPHDHGLGYRLAAQSGSGVTRQEASLNMNQSFGGIQADIVNQYGTVSTRIGLQGGINYLAGDVYFSRGFDDAFAVVRTEGLKGIPIYLENQEVARTDRHGNAIVSNLQSYQRNHIRIDPLSLPIDASVEQMEKTVIPRFKGGVIVDFAVQRVRGATLILRLKNGELLPAWSTVEVNGLERQYVSGKRGEVYVEFLKQKDNHVNVSLQDGRLCELRVDLPEDATLIPYLDNLICIEMVKQ
jgi:outer membrane usher protein